MNSFVRMTIPVLMLLASAAVRADTINLTNGRVLEGHATDNGDTVTIELAEGTVRLPKSQIKSIEKKATPQDEYAQRAAEIIEKSSDGTYSRSVELDGWLKLARFAKTSELPRSRDEAYRHVIALDPDNAEARDALGYVRYNGQWMTQAEKYQAMGMIRFEGKWISQEAAADIQRSRAAAVEAQAEADRQEAALELAQAETQRLEAQRQLLDAQRAAQEAQQQQQVVDGSNVILVPIPSYPTRPGPNPNPNPNPTPAPPPAKNPPPVTTQGPTPPEKQPPFMPISNPPIIMPGSGNMPMPGATNPIPGAQSR